jgi:hypothetical protein
MVYLYLQAYLYRCTCKLPDREASLDISCSLYRYL